MLLILDILIIACTLAYAVVHHEVLARSIGKTTPVEALASALAILLLAYLFLWVGLEGTGRMQVVWAAIFLVRPARWFLDMAVDAIRAP